MFYELLSCGGWRVATPTRKRIEIRSFSWPWDDGHRGASIVNARNSLFGVHWGMGELRREVFIGGCVCFFVFLGENTRSSSCVVSDFPTSQLQIAPQLTLALEFGGRAPEVLGTSLKLRGREIGKDVIGRSCDFMKATKKKRARVHNACNSVSEGTVWI